MGKRREYAVEAKEKALMTRQVGSKRGISRYGSGIMTSSCFRSIFVF